MAVLNRPPPPRARCPHCGYDLSGGAAAWGESCPLEGVCSECGRRIRWGVAIREGGAPPRARLSGWMAMLFIGVFFVLGFGLLALIVVVTL